MVERKVAGVVVKLTPLVVHSPFIQQLSDEPLFVACYYLRRNDATMNVMGLFQET